MTVVGVGVVVSRRGRPGMIVLPARCSRDPVQFILDSLDIRWVSGCNPMSSGAAPQKSLSTVYSMCHVPSVHMPSVSCVRPRRCATRSRRGRRRRPSCCCSSAAGSCTGRCAGLGVG
eukprot:scaffold48510_cov33-Phaeocystis_antarctica.AAC.1